MGIMDYNQVYWDYMGIMEKKIELLRSNWIYIEDNGRGNGNCYIIIGYILGLYRDNGTGNGNCYIIIRYILGLYRDNGKTWKLPHFKKVHSFMAIANPGIYPVIV